MAITLSLNSQNLEHQIGGTPPSAENIIIDFVLLSCLKTY